MIRTALVLASAWLMAALAFSTVSAQEMPEKPDKTVVAVAFPGEQRFWRRCRQVMEDHAKRNNLELRLVFSQNDQMKQNIQVRQLLKGSPDVLILAAQDALGAAAAVKAAKSARVKVLALDRLTLNADLDLYLAFDHEKAGERQAEYLFNLAPAGPYVILSGPPRDYSAYLSLKGAMKVLGPWIESGRLTVLADEPLWGGGAERARNLIRGLLAQGLQPAAVLAPDDVAAGGAADALRDAGLSNRVPVAGQNGELSAVRLIRARELSLTLVKDPTVLAVRALELAVGLARNEDLTAEVQTLIDNGRKEVPAVLLPVPLIDRHNLETAWADGTFRPNY